MARAPHGKEPQAGWTVRVVAPNHVPGASLPSRAQASHEQSSRTGLGDPACMGRQRLGWRPHLPRAWNHPLWFFASTSRWYPQGHQDKAVGVRGRSSPLSSSKLMGLGLGSQLPEQSTERPLGPRSALHTPLPGELCGAPPTGDCSPPVPHPTPPLGRPMAPAAPRWSLTTTWCGQGGGLVPFPLSYPWYLFRFPPEPTGLTETTTGLLDVPSGSPAASWLLSSAPTTPFLLSAQQAPSTNPRGGHHPQPELGLKAQTRHTQEQVLGLAGLMLPSRQGQTL